MNGESTLAAGAMEAGLLLSTVSSTAAACWCMLGCYLLAASTSVLHLLHTCSAHFALHILLNNL
jgi:hypothetical protein